MNTNRKAYYFQSDFTDSITDDLLALSNDECTKIAIQIDTVQELADNLYRVVLDDEIHPYTLAISEVLLDTGKSHHNFTHGQIAEYQNIDPEQYADKNTVIVDMTQAQENWTRNKRTITINHPTKNQWIIVSRTSKTKEQNPTHKKRTKILDQL